MFAVDGLTKYLIYMVLSLVAEVHIAMVRRLWMGSEVNWSS